MPVQVFVFPKHLCHTDKQISIFRLERRVRTDGERRRTGLKSNCIRINVLRVLLAEKGDHAQYAAIVIARIVLAIKMGQSLPCSEVLVVSVRVYSSYFVPFFSDCICVKIHSAHDCHHSFCSICSHQRLRII